MSVPERIWRITFYINLFFHAAVREQNNPTAAAFGRSCDTSAAKDSDLSPSCKLPLWGFRLQGVYLIKCGSQVNQRRVARDSSLTSASN